MCQNQSAKILTPSFILGDATCKSPRVVNNVLQDVGGIKTIYSKKGLFLREKETSPSKVTVSPTTMHIEFFIQFTLNLIESQDY